MPRNQVSKMDKGADVGIFDVLVARHKMERNKKLWQNCNKVEHHCNVVTYMCGKYYIMHHYDIIFIKLLRIME